MGISNTNKRRKKMKTLTYIIMGILVISFANNLSAATTNVVYKPSFKDGAMVQEAEAIYITTYMKFFHNRSYTNSSYNNVAIQIGSVAVTSDVWAARSFLMDKSFSIIDTWWTFAKEQLGSNQPAFHPYPWGSEVITNIVER
jgi:hypothetical protein